MKVSFGALALLSLVPAISGLTINTPSQIVQCQPFLFNWQDGTPPYYLSLLPARQVSAPALKEFPPQTGTSYTWLVDLPAGTTFTTSLRDSTGAVAYSDIATIGTGPDSSCLNPNVTETAGSATGPVQTGTASSSRASTAASSTATAKKSSGSHDTGSAAVVAVLMGLVGAALL